jgi:hypothetical protein
MAIDKAIVGAVLAGAMCVKASQERKKPLLRRSLYLYQRYKALLLPFAQLTHISMVFPNERLDDVPLLEMQEGSFASQPCRS